MSELTASDAATIESVYRSYGPPRLRNCPLMPTPRQEAFLLLHALEVFFGGAAGGGKSIALLIAGLQYSDVPGYDALLLRPTLSELQLPGGLIALSHDWLGPSRAHWESDRKLWRFPGAGRSGAGGATVGFGYLENTSDLGRYAGTSYSFLAFDELTRFDEQLYRRMFRVLRQPTALVAGAAASDGTRLADIPVRVRSASNPGGPGHSWVKQRFVDPASREPGALFLPSRLRDNPHLDPHYANTLAQLPTAERERLLNGDWEIPDDGELFRREWFQIIDPHHVPEHTTAVRYWDLAGTEPSPANRDPDYTVGIRLEQDPTTGIFYLTGIVRVRKGPGAIEHLVAATAKQDGHETTIVLEEEPGGSGKAVTDRYKRHVLAGYAVRSDRPTGPKDVRAHPVAAAAENGLIQIVRGPHTNDLLDELTAFPHGRHDDAVDALAGAHKQLTRTSNSIGSISVPKGRIPPITYANHDRRLLPYTRDPAAELAAQLGARLYPTRP
jgi:predicted phage terminase large subunit-like protein